MKQFVYVTIAMLLVGCSSVETSNKTAANNNKNSGLGLNSQSAPLENEIQKRETQSAISILKNAKIDVYQDTRFVANSINEEGKAEGFRCVTILENDKNPFSKAGIQINDVVLAINQRELRTLKEAQFFFDLVKANQYSSIKIQRGSRIFTLRKVSFTEEG